MLMFSIKSTPNLNGSPTLSLLYYCMFKLQETNLGEFVWTNFGHFVF